jgi:TolB-like protein
MNSRNILFFALCTLLLALCFSLFSNVEAAQPTNKIRIALFPFENLTDDKNAPVEIMPVLKSRLEKKGLEIADEDSLNKFLLKERVRSTGYISRDIAQKMEKELHVKAILVGSITSYYPLKNPQAGVLARLIDSSSGAILWANQASATGDDFTKILGLGTVRSMDELIPIVVDRLLNSFSITPRYKEKELTHRVAVMPFQNKSKHQDAGTIVTYMFLVDLLKQEGFEPVEYGDIRRLTVDLRVRSRGELDYRSIESFSEGLDVDGILVGTVEIYSDGLDTSSPPEVAISARLINAHKDKIIWSDSIQVKGDQGIIALDWGRIRAVDSVAYKAVRKLIQKMEKAKWQ